MNLAYKPPTSPKVSCKNDCGKFGDLRCSGCFSVFYCSKECQKSHWSLHKKECKSKKQTETNQNRSDSKEEMDDKLKNAMEKLKTLKTEDSSKICELCNNPAILLDYSVTPSPDGIGAVAYAIFICKNGHSSTCTDAIMGSEQDCNCNKTVTYKMQLPPYSKNIVCSYPTVKRFLIVVGFGIYPNIDKITLYLRNNSILYDVIEANDGELVTQKLKSGNYSKIMLYQLDDKSSRMKMKMFQGGHFLVHLIPWIKGGGKFIIHGEGDIISIITEIVISKSWHFCGDFYRRCKHSLNKNNNPSVDTDNFPKSYSMKATMLSGVDKEDQIYSPKENGTVALSNVPGFADVIVKPFRTAIAATSLEMGVFCYIGDVNTEDSTIQFMSIL